MWKPERGLLFAADPLDWNPRQPTNQTFMEQNMTRLRTVDEILDFAIAREIEAHHFYVHLAEIVRDPDLRQAVRGFAIDELQHRIRLQAIKDGESSFTREEVGSLDVAETAPNAEPGPDMSYVDLLAIAMNREKTAFRIYTNLASIAKNDRLGDTLLGLAKEEAQHKLRLEIEYDWETS